MMTERLKIFKALAAALAVILAVCIPVFAGQEDLLIQEIGQEDDLMKELSDLDAKISEEMAELDTEDEERITDLMDDLEAMKQQILHIIWDYQGQGSAYLRYDEIRLNGVTRFVRLPDKNLEYSVHAWMNPENGALVIWGVGGDAYDLYYVADGTLLGYIRGYSSGEIGVDEHLPGWLLKTPEETGTEDETEGWHDRLTDPYYEEIADELQDWLTYLGMAFPSAF